MADNRSQSVPIVRRVLVDTNVALDQLVVRQPWFAQAQPFWQARDAGRVVAFLSTTTITDLYYIARCQVGSDEARRVVDRCLREFGLIVVTRAVLEQALALTGSGFEDNVQIACATSVGPDLIVTRDVLGFRQSPIPDHRAGSHRQSPGAVAVSFL